MTRQRPLTTVLAALGALIALVILLFPLYAVIIGSFETNSQLIAASHYNFFPPSWTLANYRAVVDAEPQPSRALHDDHELDDALAGFEFVVVVQRT